MKLIHLKTNKGGFINKMRSVSEKFFLAAIVVQTILGIILIAVGSIGLSVSISEYGLYLIPGVCSFLGIAIAIPVKLKYQYTRPVLVAVISFLFLGSLGVPAGILLIVANYQESQNIS